MTPHITLTVAGGRYDGRAFRFEDGTTCTLGRSPDCDVQVPSDPTYLSVSRHHCTFFADGPNLRIRDDHSMNGTYINGQLLPRGTGRALKDGDFIWVGHLVLRVSMTEEPDVPVEAEELAGEALAMNL